MLLGEPPPTQADLHFRIFGFPVRIHPFFWLLTLLLTLGGRQKVDPLDAVIWVVVVFVSILVHELGHALTQRYFGGHPWITLYGLGGLSSCDDCDRSPRSQIIISLAGPIAGFALAALVMLTVRLSGREIGLALMREIGNLLTAGFVVQPLIVAFAYFEPFASEPLISVVADLLQVNILWGLINLLPIYPLDGGQVARELFTLQRPRQGIIQSLQLSIGAAALMAIYGLLARQSFFTAFMFGYLAYINYQTLQAYRGRY